MSPSVRGAILRSRNGQRFDFGLIYVSSLAPLAILRAFRPLIRPAIKFLPGLSVLKFSNFSAVGFWFDSPTSACFFKCMTALRHLDEE